MEFVTENDKRELTVDSVTREGLSEVTFKLKS